ncbi:hypothetical protein L6452_01716 [Arctium lappa]|uniref:Uncharacterized protein n=1 Tax=Arctium lappa TaxID=4217 RepID=A0ACB9FI27_ARCLA|nr:hypothetical protein L6452_01716 [Arctium lappa]
MISSSKQTAVNANDDDHYRQILQSEWMVVGMRSGKCNGTVGECFISGGDDIDGKSKRRILAGKRYVSYGALQKNNVPCSRRGASYYNCRQGGQANPYTRGCNAITHCRS